MAKKKEPVNVTLNIIDDHDPKETGKIQLPVVTVKATKRPFVEQHYSDEDLIKEIIEIAESCRDDGEGLEECLFVSTTFVVEEFFDKGINYFKAGKLIEKHFENSEYRLPAIVFRHYCHKVGSEVQGDQFRMFFDGINKRSKARQMQALRKTNKAEQDRKEKACIYWQSWQKDKSLYKNQEAYIDAMKDKHGVSRQTVFNWLEEWEGKPS